MELNYFHADSLAKFSVKYVTPTYLYKSLLPLIEEAGSTEQNHGGMLGRRLSEGDITPSWGDFCILLGLAFVMWIFMKILFYIAGYWQRKAIARMQKALEIRNNNPDNFRRENGYSWDFAIVFKVNKAKEAEQMSDFAKKHSLTYMVLKMADAGLQTKMYYSVQHDEVYLKIRAPMKRFLKQCEFCKYRMACDPRAVANLLRIGNQTGPEETQWGPISIETDGIQTEIEPYEYIYAPYREEFNDPEKMLYKKYNKSILRGCDRIKLLKDILEGQETDGGCDLNIYDLKKEGCILDFFPIHDEVELRDLESRWFVFWQQPKDTPVGLVKDYFGEKIALFFGFLSWYTAWLFWASFFAFWSWVDVAYNEDDPDVITAPIFAAFMSVWATLFLDSWRKQQKRLAMEWGTVDIVAESQPRPAFLDHPDVIDTEDPVDGSKMKYFPPEKSVPVHILSKTTSFFFVLCVIAAVIGMFAAKFIMDADEDLSESGFSTTLAAILNAVIVGVMGGIYSYVANTLNDMENHRTDIDYEDSLIAKTFVVQFINAFSAMFFIAFGQPFLAYVSFSGTYYVRRCVGSCLKQIQQTLSVLFMSNLTTGSLLAILVPYINQRVKAASEFADTNGDDASLIEREFLLDEYELTLGPFKDYATYTIQFAYATMFISAYPLATLLATCFNYIMLRINCWAFCHLRKRPVPQAVEDIGSWEGLLELISYLAVFVSAGLVAFTGSLCINYQWTSRAWIFIGFIMGVYIVKYMISTLTSSVADDVKIQLDRNKFIIDKLYFNVPDDNDDKIKEDIQKGEKAKYIIRVTDDDPL